MSRVALTYDRRQWILELLLLLAEGFVVWMVAALLVAPFRSGSQPIPLPLVLGLVLAAGLVPRWLHDSGIWDARYTGAVIAAIVGSTLVTIRAISFPGDPWLDSGWLREAGRSLVFAESTADVVVWVPVALSLAVWWLARFHGAPGLDRSRATLQAGTVACALVATGSMLVARGPSDRAISLAIVAFFGATLLALAIARQNVEATRSARRIGTTVLLPTAAILAVAAAITGLLTADALRTIPDTLAPLGVILDPIFRIVLLVMTLIAIAIALPILWLLSLGNPSNPPVDTPVSDTNPGATARSALEWQPPDMVRYAIAIAVLVIAVYAIARFGLHLTRRDPERDETGRRSFGTGSRRGSWFDRLRWPFGRSTDDPMAAIRNDPDWSQTVRIRETYAAWLRWAQQRRMGRHGAETALELDHRTGPNLSPAAVAALDELTAIYDEVRYSNVPASPALADRAEDAWRRLRQAEAAATRP